MKIGFPIGLSIGFWGLMGLVRRLTEKRSFLPPPGFSSPVDREVAVCVPAHNEELTLPHTIASLNRLLPSKNIYVVSDGSHDCTADTARKLGCHVLKLSPGRGKAIALEKVISHFNLLDKYQFILLSDADTTYDPDFLQRALWILHNNSTVAVVTAHGQALLQEPPRMSWGMFFITYRTRLWWILQTFLAYGQTWHHANVYPVAPGFASLYRTSALRHLKISIPGLAIEDFNMAFQLHKKKLGKIGYSPRIKAMSQDPDNLYDYWRQVQRWNVGFWQTIRYWGFWPSWFWLSLSVFLIENILMALYTLLVPSLITLAIFITVSSSIAWNDPFGILVAVLLLGGFVALNALDYVITLAIAWRLRLPTMAIYGLGYFLLRYVDAIILLTSVPRAFLKASNGKWSPPKRWVNGHKKIPLAQTT